MGVDAIIDLDCDVKRELRGTEGLVQLLKVRAIAKVALAAGGESVTRMTLGPGGAKHVGGEQDLAQLQAACAPLKTLKTHCKGCPAACGNKSFGCVTMVRYPFAASAEAWFAERLPSSKDSVPGFFFRTAIKDFGYTGQPIRDWRRRGLFERDEGIRKKDLNTDQLLQAMFCVGPMLNPHHCLLIPLWLDLVRYEGKRLSKPQDVANAMSLSVAERAEKVAIAIGKRSEDPGEADARRLVRALFRAWILERPMIMDA